MTGRYAIYAVPGTGTAAPGRPTDGAGPALRQRAERWLGRGLGGDPVSAAVPDGWTRAQVDAITVDARRYGFHATLKAPFRLAGGRTAGELDTALARFAASRRPVTIPRLTLARLGRFYALVPGEAAAPAAALADAVVTGFDQFRAPLTEAETARRHPATLTPRQRELLAAWGYPYVLDEFRLHLTVTDQIPRRRQPAVEDVLTRWFAADLGATVPLDTLALCTEIGPGAPFALRTLYPLRPWHPAVRPWHPAEGEGTR